MLLVIGFGLLLLAYFGNPSQAFAAVVGYLSGQKAGSASKGSGGATQQTLYVPANVSSSLAGGTPAKGKAPKGYTAVHPAAPITTVQKGGKTVYQVPTKDLTTGARLQNWFNTHNPFWNSGVAKP